MNGYKNKYLEKNDYFEKVGNETNCFSTTKKSNQLNTVL